MIICCHTYFFQKNMIQKYKKKFKMVQREFVSRCVYKVDDQFQVRQNNYLSKLFDTKEEAEAHFATILKTMKRTKSQFLEESKAFHQSLKHQEVPFLRQGSSFLTFFTFFLLKLGSCIFALQAPFGGLIFGVVTVLGRSSGLF